MLVVAFKVVLPLSLACLQAPERCRDIYPCVVVVHSSLRSAQDCPNKLSRMALCAYGSYRRLSKEGTDAIRV